ncbi:hypothetical protein RESH_06191 [Rhodopirellula europaea SH398]|uniref:Uncharacterized protein n=1 Tax=Rhodopirellula europaea SH398 TaxID=1263868 RepID=M5SAX2_9BACT|nr:hypothetical protein RESH_06191 [Rhodopirellula europaea SH398]
MDVGVSEFGDKKQRGSVGTVADVKEHAERSAADYCAGHGITLRKLGAYALPQFIVARISGDLAV